MKINQLFYVFLLLAGLLLLPEASRAQVKIGNNYTTIGSNSNLEVEATNGKKVIVNKADGSMVIETTPTSTSASDKLLAVDGAGKVVTVDRTTVISSVSATGTLPVAPYIRLEGTFPYQTNIGYNGSLSSTGTIKGLSTTFSNLINYNSSTGDITITSPGVYFITFSILPSNLSTAATQNDVCAFLVKNGALVEVSCSRSQDYVGTTAVLTGLYKFGANDILSLRLSTSSNLGITSNYLPKVSIYKMSD
ncbi:hypothetical protein F5984_24605 [Rudanella paleaurantiibacter]|uniref:C1q domain-containing protein n=1 Tax=Rudanella paleaurantiibacter TaxID=2614655 RepID=A0A7J5TTD4_9BACT|nr:hypothetical protein [Rudanella paleaurantiibacter]KAB7726500.1 hypothetical protein F5984_24605 [Rudanella paleaurantiibacter]